MTTETHATNGQSAPATDAEVADQAPSTPARPARSRPRSASASSRSRSQPRKVKAKPKAKKAPGTTASVAPVPKFPRHPVERALRIPRVILDQNAGHETSQAEAAAFFGGKVSGEFRVEVSSAKKYGFLTSQAGGKLAITDRAKHALRPQNDTDEISALREAILDAPDFSAVYNHYRGENLPDDKFFANALTERFKIPEDKVSDFRDVFTESLRSAHLIDDANGRIKLIDIGRDNAPHHLALGDTARGALASTSHVPATDDTCFVIQPFSDPYGGYYETIFKPAVEQAGIVPVRADNEIFGAGKIVDQVWRGIRQAKVLLAELTTRNANVYYELGLAHAQGKPVVLIAAKGEDVPFDVSHIRVVYYDVNDPFWGSKLINKVAENIRSALTNPEEAVLRVAD